MTDEQILKRLAEIEGLTLPVDCKCECHRGPMHEAMNIQHVVACCALGWNPLTNWSDLGPLIEKYVQTIEKHADSPNIKEYWRGKYTVLTLDDAGVATNESLPHAICLAIIEANGGMRDE